MFSTSSNSLDICFKLAVIAASTVIVFTALSWVADFLSPLIILVSVSLMITYILLAPVNGLNVLFSKVFSQLSTLHRFFSRLPKALPRICAILTVYMATLIVMSVISIRFVPEAAIQLQQFIHQIPVYVEQGEDWLVNQPILQGYLHKELTTLQAKGEIELSHQELDALQSNPRAALTEHEKKELRQKVLNTAERVNQLIQSNIPSASKNLLPALGSTLTALVYSLTTLMLVFYFLLDGVHLKNMCVHFLSPPWQNKINTLLHELHMVMFGFIKSQVMLGVATGLYMIIIYSLFDVPYAFFLGGFFAIAEILPVVGTWIGFTPGILVLLFTNPYKLVVIMAFVYVYQTIKDNVVAPKIMGDIMGLHPVIVIMSLLVCAKVAGLVGVLFAIPLASMVNVLLRYIQQHEEEINPAPI